MPVFSVRICTNDLVLRSADVKLQAASATSARREIQRRIDEGDDFHDAEWFDSDRTGTDEEITITSIDQA